MPLSTGKRLQIATFSNDKYLNYNYFKSFLPRNDRFKWFKDSLQFKKYVDKQIWLHQHPFAYEIIFKDKDIVRFKYINFTHSSKDLIIDDILIKKIHVGYYIKDGEHINVFLVDCNYIVEMPLNFFNIMIKNVDLLKDEEIIKELGGINHINNMLQTAEFRLDLQQSFDYKKTCIYGILEPYLNQYNKNNLYYPARLDEE